MLCFILSGAFSYARAVSGKERKGDGDPVEIIEKTSLGQLDRSSSILVSIDGHVLSVVFTENLGQVNIDITTAAGASVDYNSLNTPNGVNFYIPFTGSYVVTFTLPNGDEYYGEFEVTD